jgi:hypothetical protein
MYYTAVHISSPAGRDAAGIAYKLFCLACGATLDFGQHKDATQGLFAKRKDKDTGKRLPNRGWYVYGSESTPEQLAAVALDLASLPAWLAGKPTAEQLNDAMPVLSRLHNGEKAKAWKMLRDFATATKIPYDDANKRFLRAA